MTTRRDPRKDGHPGQQETTEPRTNLGLGELAAFPGPQRAMTAPQKHQPVTSTRLRATQQTNPQASRSPQHQKIIQPPTLQTRHRVAPSGVKPQLLTTLFLPLAALALTFSLYTPTIGTTPITCTPHLARLTATAPSPFIPTPQPNDWIGAFYDTLAARNQNHEANKPRGRRRPGTN